MKIENRQQILGAAAIALVTAFFLKEIPLRTSHGAPAAAPAASRATPPGRPAVSID